MPTRYGKYSYYDTPDGSDGPKKMWYIGKIMAKIGVVTASVDAFVVSKPATKLGVLGVYARHLTVLVGAGLAYTTMTFISTDFRQKDDQKNHVVGAVAASAVMGAALRNPWIFVTLAGVSSPIVHVLKTYRMQGVNVFNTEEQLKKKKFIYPSATWHNFELDRPKISLQQMYDQKNEEYYQHKADSK